MISYLKEQEYILRAQKNRTRQQNNMRDVYMEVHKMKVTQKEIERVIEEVWNPLDPKRIALALLEKFNIKRKEE